MRLDWPRHGIIREILMSKAHTLKCLKKKNYLIFKKLSDLSKPHAYKICEYGCFC